jgi:hypothetical protein
VFVERITDREKEYGYLVAVYGPFRSDEEAARWIPRLKRDHPDFADDAVYWIGVRPLKSYRRGV